MSNHAHRMSRRGLALLPLLIPAAHVAGQRAEAPSTIIHELLGQDLWTDRDAYDAANVLMMPMHAAFLGCDAPELIDAYHDFMKRFTETWSAGEFVISSNLNRYQFLLVVGRYLRLAGDKGALLSMMADEVRAAFLEREFAHWEHDTFANIRDSIEWKLSNPATSRQYYTMLIDQELFVLVMAAEVYACLGGEAPDHVVEARDLGLRVLRERGAWGPDGEWQFQFGAAWDHQDFAYAGYSEPEPDMQPKPIEGIAGDTSHAHRQPLILRAFDPEGIDPDLAGEIADMRVGLARQFVNHALVMPDDSFRNIRTTNYLDGNNGLYRWEYKSLGENSGYLPYQTSGTFFLGWWSLLGSESVQRAYRIAFDCLPFTPEEIALYRGPATNRERNPIIVADNARTVEGIYGPILSSAVLVGDHLSQ